MKKILITGGSGLIGNKLTSYLEKKGFKVAWLSRKPKKKKQKSFGWDIKNQTIDQKALNWCDAVIHLAGAGIADKRWTDERKKEILESRTLSARLLYQNIQKCEQMPQTFISASGVNYYGFNSGSNLLDEQSSPGDDFLAETVIKWEEEVLKIQTLGIRTVVLRTGAVLDKKEGALAKMMKPPIAAPLGSGNQYMSWIHINDLAMMYIHALTHEGISGIYNAVAPHPVLNKTFTKIAAKEKGKPFVGIPVPSFVLKTVLGEMANIVTGGSKVSSAKIQESGFKFKFPFVEEALQDIYKKR
ncbi:MAG: TIGR01777 family oxidoreductase [Anditalea sp.]